MSDWSVCLGCAFDVSMEHPRVYNNNDNSDKKSTIINEKRNLIVNPVTGVGGASPSDDGADQADSG
ncbi:hypothetical protein, partial [Candidatus Ichthyocystis sparus]|uniref:hypothetical protein n=1 Tax=Candidatus Ichthyocystis sparus TaxID=1561004 RepID=UPI00114614F9